MPQYLKLTVQWPGWIEDGMLAIMKDCMLKKFQQQIPKGTSEDEEEQLLESYRDFIFLYRMALVHTMMGLRPLATSPKMEAETRFKLDMAVNKLTLNDWHIIGDEEGMRVLVVDLKAFDEKKYEEEETPTAYVGHKHHLKE